MATEFAKEVVRICRGRVGVQARNLVCDEVEQYLKARFGAQDVVGDEASPFIVDRTNVNDGPLWVWCNNLFVAFVSKKALDEGDEDEGERVIQELLRASQRL